MYFSMRMYVRGSIVSAMQSHHNCVLPLGRMAIIDLQYIHFTLIMNLFDFFCFSSVSLPFCLRNYLNEYDGEVMALTCVVIRWWCFGGGWLHAEMCYVYDVENNIFYDFHLRVL